MHEADVVFRPDNKAECRLFQLDTSAFKYREQLFSLPDFARKRNGPNVDSAACSEKLNVVLRRRRAAPNIWADDERDSEKGISNARDCLRRTLKRERVHICRMALKAHRGLGQSEME